MRPARTAPSIAARCWANCQSVGFRSCSLPISPKAAAVAATLASSDPLPTGACWCWDAESATARTSAVRFADANVPSVSGQLPGRFLLPGVRPAAGNKRTPTTPATSGTATATAATNNRCACPTRRPRLDPDHILRGAGARSEQVVGSGRDDHGRRIPPGINAEVGTHEEQYAPPCDSFRNCRTSTRGYLPGALLQPWGTAAFLGTMAVALEMSADGPRSGKASARRSAVGTHPARPASVLWRPNRRQRDLQRQPATLRPP